MTISQAKIRLVAVAAGPVIYQTPLYRRLAADPRLELTVVFASSGGIRPYDAGFGGRLVVWDEDLVSGYRHEFLHRADRNDVLGGFLALCDWDVVDRIRGGHYDAVWIHGYSYATLWLAILAAKLSRLPLLIREEQTLLHKRPPYREAIRRLVLRRLFKRAVGLYIGANNRDFFRAYGVREEWLFPAPYCVDNEALQRHAEAMRADRDPIRRRFGLAGPDPVILFVGRLYSKKDPLTLVRAFREVRSRFPCRLLVVGEGPLEQEMRQTLGADTLADVKFVGFLNRSEIMGAYAAADVLCLPSALHETWGIVVNEALNFSLPVVVSEKVGCARDLVHEGENGFIVPVGSSPAMAHALTQLIADPDRRLRYGQRSLEIISKWHMGIAVEGIISAAAWASGRCDLSEPAEPKA